MFEVVTQTVEDIFGWEFKNGMELNLTSNHDKFVVVDGEEGDYGIIEYFDGDQLFMITTIHGGDSEETELTPHGKKVIGNLMMERINKWQTD